MTKQKNILKSLMLVSVSSFLVACGTVDAKSNTFSNEGFLKGSAFDDSQGSSGGNFGLRVRCEVRSNRSKVSVDATSIASGAYKASVISGGVEVMSGLANSVGDEVEFDFDSDSGDIAEGATTISTDFIEGGLVTGRIYNSTGVMVAAVENVECELK